MNIFKKVFFAALACVGLTANAAFEFTNIDSSDLKSIIKELGNNFTYTPVSGASTLGSIFGFKVGLIAGTTSTPEIANLSGSGESIPHAAILGRISIPFGLTFGLNYVPSTKLGDATIGVTGIEAQWTISEGLLVIPFDLALRGTYSTASFGFSQTISSVDTDVSSKITSTSLAIIAGLDLVVVKPYAGIGTVNVNGNLDIDSSTSFFNGDLAGETDASETVSGTQLLMGVDFSLLIMDLGVEFAQQLGSNRYTAKVAFGF
jgi:hypothetical protein